MGLLSRPNSFRKDEPATEEVTAASRMLHPQSSSLHQTLTFLLRCPSLHLPRPLTDVRRAHTGCGSFATQMCSNHELSVLLSLHRSSWNAAGSDAGKLCLGI